LRAAGPLHAAWESESCLPQLVWTGRPTRPRILAQASAPSNSWLAGCTCVASTQRCPCDPGTHLSPAFHALLRCLLVVQEQRREHGKAYEVDHQILRAAALLLHQGRLLRELRGAQVTGRGARQSRARPLAVAAPAEAAGVQSSRHLPSWVALCWPAHAPGSAAPLTAGRPQMWRPLTLRKIPGAAAGAGSTPQNCTSWFRVSAALTLVGCRTMKCSLTTPPPTWKGPAARPPCFAACAGGLRQDSRIGVRVTHPRIDAIQRRPTLDPPRAACSRYVRTILKVRASARAHLAGVWRQPPSICRPNALMALQAQAAMFHTEL